MGNDAASRIACNTLAEREGVIVGMAEFGVLENGEGELYKFYVLPEHQGQGIGDVLWAETRRELLKKGCARMRVWTFTRNHKTRAFYERRGGILFAEQQTALGNHVKGEVDYRVELADG